MTTATDALIPEALLSLKETARRTTADRERLARETAEREAADSWARLLDAARQTIPAEMMLFTGTTRPDGFDGRTRRYSMTFVLPGHADIRARFDRDSAGTWTRSTPAGKYLVPGGEQHDAWEVVCEVQRERRTAATLGEALVLAEEMGGGDGDGVDLAALASGSGVDDDDLPF